MAQPMRRRGSGKGAGAARSTPLTSSRRDKKVVFEAKEAELDGYGGEDVAWAEHCTEWAAKYDGSGREQREAAQLAGAQTATFEVLANSKTRALSVQHRVRYPVSDPDRDAWPVWDIQAITEIGRAGFAIVATRAT